MRFLMLLLMLAILPAMPAWADCANPPAPEGRLVYNAAHKVVQYCNGTHWVAAGGGVRDARIGLLVPGKWCAANAGGTGLDCNVDPPLTAPAGAAGQIQFNDGGALGADTRLVWDNTAKQLRINSPAVDGGLQLTGNLRVTGLTTLSGGGLVVEHAMGKFRFIADATANYIQSAPPDAAHGDFRRLHIGGWFSTANIKIAIDDLGNVGVNTLSPQATLDVKGFGRLSLNSAAPAPCVTARHGAIALTSTAEMCVCTTASAWQKVNTVTACSW